jgi:hypothetical protein
VTKGPCVNAANVVLTRRAHEQLVGTELVTSALASLPRETVEAYTRSTIVGWVPVNVIDDVTIAICRATTAWTPERLQAESSRHSVEALLRGLWKVMLRFTSDDALIARTPLLYSRTFDTGRLESSFPRPGHADVVQSGWPTISDLQVIGLSAGIETVLRCADRAHPRVTSKRTPTGVTFVATWTP